VEKFTSIGRILTKPYMKESLKPQEATRGLALGVRQKIALTELELVADAVIMLGTERMTLKTGGKLVLREEDLHNGTACSKNMTYSGIEGEFMLVESNYIIGYIPPEL
jgi:hypothetical protein